MSQNGGSELQSKEAKFAKRGGGNPPLIRHLAVQSLGGRTFYQVSRQAGSSA
jgi:hypothetical protein